MIPASKQPTFNAWFAAHARARIRRAFGRVRVHGLELAATHARRGPVLVVSNHTSWWDPLVALHASEHLLRTDGYALMDARNLRRLPFFARVGGFGVDLDDPRDGAHAIRYAARLLDRPGRLVWVFPQGRERPITERPLAFQAGAAAIARVAPRAVTLPVALRYEFGGEERPDLYISFGEPVTVGTMGARDTQEAAVEVELARVERAVGGMAGDFEDSFRAGAGVVGALATTALAGLMRGAVSSNPGPRSGAGPRDRR